MQSELHMLKHSPFLCLFLNLSVFSGLISGAIGSGVQTAVPHNAHDGERVRVDDSVQRDEKQTLLVSINIVFCFTEFS